VHGIAQRGRSLMPTIALLNFERVTWPLRRYGDFYFLK